MEGYLGEVKMFAGTYAPMNWAFCQGQLLDIANYQSLYAVLGIQFGGDGRTNFALPDLRGRVPVGSGSGPGRTPRVQGQYGGYETVHLTADSLPAHNHAVACDMKTATRSLSAVSENNVPAQITQGEGFGSDLSGGTYMNQEMITNTGNGNSHENMQPWEAMNYIICVQGIFPPRS